MRTSPSCNCCGVRCLLEEDDFNRADDTDLGSGWTEAAGSWSIASNELTTSSTSAACVRANNHPSGIVSHYVTVRVKGGGAGDRARVFVAYVNNTTAYLAVELEFDDTMDGVGCGTLRLIENGSILHEIPIRGLATDRWATVVVCYQSDEYANGGILWGTVETESHGTWTASCYASGTGQKVGVGTGSTASSVQFDDFSWHNVDIDPEDEESCPECFLCPIWESNTTYDVTDCVQTITGTPYAPLNSSAWEITPDTTISDSDEANDYGVSVNFDPVEAIELTITLGDYVATLTEDSGDWVITIVGTGVNVSATASGGVGITETVFRFSYINGGLCAGVDGFIAATAVPTASVNGVSAAGNKGRVFAMEVSRCPSCPSECGCGDTFTSGFTAEISGFDGDAGCLEWNDTWATDPTIVQYTDTFRYGVPSTWFEGATASVCSWGHTVESNPRDLGENWVVVRVMKQHGIPGKVFVEVALIVKAIFEVTHHVFFKEYDVADLACDGFVDEDIPLQRNITGCTGTPICTLTSI